MDDQPLDHPLPAPASEAAPTPANPDQPASPLYGALGAGYIPTPEYPVTPQTPPAPQTPYPSHYAGAPSTPLYPGLPGAPAAPSSPAYPIYPEAPSTPMYSGAPSGAPAPGYPPGYGYAAQPSTPFYPTTPTTPTYPMYPTYPNTYPGYPGGPSGPFNPAFQLAPPPKQPSPLSRPFPIWLTAAIFFGALFGLGLLYLLAIGVFRADWSGGVIAVSIAAFLGALTVLIIALIRILLGRRAISTVLLSVAMALLLIVGGIGGLANAQPLHLSQAKALEQSGQWSAAIHEYALSGEATPNARDIARVYDEWGEQLLAQNQYAQAVTRFTSVTSDYSQSGDDLVSRANDGLFKAYSAWIAANDNTAPYSDAITFFESYGNSSACDASCQSSVAESEAQARYQYGVQLLNSDQYTAAISQFEAVQKQFAHSSYAHQAHLQAAVAYLALGKQQIASTCANAIPTYQTLAKSYGDTPQGREAKSALAAPQDVTGTLTHFPNDPLPIMYLSRSGFAPSYHTTSAPPGSFGFSYDYRTSLDPQTGNFTFHSIPSGSYTLNAYQDFGGGSYNVSWWLDQSESHLYFFQVTPLCPTNIGNFNDSNQH